MLIVTEYPKCSLLYTGSFPWKLVKIGESLTVLKAKPQTYLIMIPLKIISPCSTAVHVIFMCTFPYAYVEVSYCLSTRRCRTLYDYNTSLLAPLPEWHYGDEKNDYADEARLRLLRIFTNMSQGVIKRERVLKRMKFQSPLLASAAITC